MLQPCAECSKIIDPNVEPECEMGMSDPRSSIEIFGSYYCVSCGDKLWRNLSE